MSTCPLCNSATRRDQIICDACYKAAVREALTHAHDVTCAAV